MTTVDAQGNIHDRTGQFTEKQNSAPTGGLGASEPDRRFSRAYYDAQARLAEAQEVMRRETLRAIRSQIPEGAVRAEFYSEDGTPLSFAYFADENGEEIEGSREQVDAMYELAFQLDTDDAELMNDPTEDRWAADRWSVPRIDPNAAVGLAGAKQRLAEAQDRYKHLSGEDRDARFQADRDIHEAAIDVMREAIKEAEAPIAEVRLHWSDQGDDTLRVDKFVDHDGNAYDGWDEPWGIYDDVDQAAMDIDAPSTHLSGEGFPLTASENGQTFVLKIGAKR